MHRGCADNKIREARHVKIAVVTARYSVSGVPLAQIRLAEAWRRQGADVDVLFGTIDASQQAPLEIEGLIDFGERRTVLMLPKIMGYLRTARPDVVFSAEDHLNAVVLLAAILVRSPAKICCSSRVTPFDTYGRGGLLKRVALKQIMRAVFWRATLLTCVSRDMAAQYHQIFGETGHQCVYNIVDKGVSSKLMKSPVRQEWLDDPNVKVVIAAGSLEPWKGFADLIRAMTRVEDVAKLLILGEGSQRKVLESSISELGLSDRVQLLGQVSNPLAYFSKADVFALSSRLEGMPNVLVEAMMCGCTPVAMDCPTGPSELLHGGDFGELVPVGDWEAFGDAINRALRRPAPRVWLDGVIAPFSEEAVIGRYRELLGADQALGHGLGKVVRAIERRIPW